MHHDRLLGTGELGLEVMRCVRAVSNARALLPFVGGLLGDAVALGEHRSGI